MLNKIAEQKVSEQKVESRIAQEALLIRDAQLIVLCQGGGRLGTTEG